MKIAWTCMDTMGETFKSNKDGSSEVGDDALNPRKGHDFLKHTVIT
jgi:hypothetical protein